MLSATKIVSTPKNLLCKFCRSDGNDEKYCQAYQFFSECTTYTYRMKGEDHAKGSGTQFNQQQGGF